MNLYPPEPCFSPLLVSANSKAGTPETKARVRTAADRHAALGPEDTAPRAGRKPWDQTAAKSNAPHVHCRTATGFKGVRKYKLIYQTQPTCKNRNQRVKQRPSKLRNRILIKISTNPKC